MTQAELAKRIGVSQGYLSTVEHGQGEIGAEVLLAISRESGWIVGNPYLTGLWKGLPVIRQLRIHCVP